LECNHGACLSIADDFLKAATKSRRHPDLVANGKSRGIRMLQELWRWQKLLSRASATTRASTVLPTRWKFAGKLNGPEIHVIR